MSEYIFTKSLSAKRFWLVIRIDYMERILNKDISSDVLEIFQFLCYYLKRNIFDKPHMSLDQE